MATGLGRTATGLVEPDLFGVETHVVETILIVETDCLGQTCICDAAAQDCR